MKFRRALKIAAAVVGVVVLMVAAAVAFLTTRDFGQYKDLFAAAARDATGRELVIAGDLRLDIDFTPALAVDGVSLANAPWGSRPAMIRFRRLEAELALLPLLVGEIRFTRLVLKGPDILLETDASGRGNWEFDAAPETAKGETAKGETGDDGAPPIVPTARVVSIENGKLTYRDGRTGERWTVILKRFTARAMGAAGGEDAGAPLRIEVLGAYDRHVFSLRGIVGAPSGLAGKGPPWTLDVDVEALGTRVGLKGSLAKPLELAGLDLAVAVESDDLSPLAAAAGLEGIGRIGPFSLKARFADTPEAWVVSSLRATLAGSDLAGRAMISRRAGPLKIRAKVISSLLDLDRLLAALPPPAPRPADDGRLFSAEKLPFDGLRGLDARVDARLARIRIEGITISRVSLDLAVRKGGLKVRSLAARLAGGTVSGQASVSAAKTSVALDLKAVDFGMLLKRLGLTEMFEGRGDLALDVAGSGRSPRAIAAGLSGRVDLTVDKGRVFSDYVKLLGADLLRSIAPWASSDKDAELHCLVGRFAIAEGIATSRGLLLDTARVTIAGRGTIDLRTEKLDLLLKPQPKEASLLSLAVPIDVSGTLAAPEFAPNKLSVAKGVAGAIIGSLMGPIGLLVPLVAMGTGDNNPCVAALAGEPAPARPGVAADDEDSGDGDLPAPERLMEDIGKGIGDAIKGLLGR